MSDIRKAIEKLGYKPAPQLNLMDDWLDWYRGKVDSFHDYNIFNGKNIIKRTRDSMCMAKQVCADWASLLLNEKVAINIANKKQQAWIDKWIKTTGWYDKANKLVELTFALGTGALVEYMKNGQPAIDYVRGNMIFPLSWEHGDITECAFASLTTINGDEFFYIQAHVLENGQYVVKNHLRKKDGDVDVPLPEGVAAEWKTGSELPMFQIIKPNLVNNVDLDSPYGISCYANAIGRLKKVDLIFDSGNNEFSLGRKRIMMPMSLLQDTTDNGTPIFDPNDVVFYAWSTMESELKDGKPIDLTGQLRIAEHSQGLQDALNYLADGVGLGTDRYDYSNAGGLKTATEVISEESTLYSNIKRHEQVLEAALTGMVRALAHLAGFSTDTEVTIKFDDSIITDENTQIDNAVKLTSAGLKSKLTAIMELYGLSEKEAEKELARIDAERAASMPAFASIDTFTTEGEEEPETSAQEAEEDSEDD